MSSRSTSCLVALALLAALSSRPALAQPKPGTIQPDRLHLGVVRDGTPVEASVRVYTGGPETEKLRAELAVPPFVRVESVERGKQGFGGAREMAYCDLTLTVAPGAVGEHADSVTLTVGEQQFSVPVRVEVLPLEPGLTRVLVVSSPFEKYTTDDGSMFDPWTSLVRAANLDVAYWLVNAGKPVLRGNDLKNFDVILVDPGAMLKADAAEVDRLKAFAEEGGRVIVPANHFFQGSVSAANRLLQPQGLRMIDVESNETREYKLTGDAVARDPFTKGVTKVAFFRPSPIEVVDADRARILVKTPEDATHGFVGVARVGKGEVVALASSLWWVWIGRDAKGSDNLRLLRNLITNPR